MDQWSSSLTVKLSFIIDSFSKAALFTAILYPEYTMLILS